MKRLASIVPKILCVLQCYFTVTNAIEKIFSFDENCSFRDVLSKECVSCYHGELKTPNLVECTPDFKQNICPEAVKIEQFYVAFQDSDSLCLILTVKISEFDKVESFDIKKIWNRPFTDNVTSGIKYSPKIIHASTLTFTDYNYHASRKQPSNEEKLRTVYRNVTFCGLIDYGYYDIETLAHPLCGGGKGVFWTKVDIGSVVRNNLTLKSRVKKLETLPHDDCPVPMIIDDKTTTVDPLKDFGTLLKGDPNKDGKVVDVIPIALIILCIVIVVFMGIVLLVKRTCGRTVPGTSTPKPNNRGPVTTSRLSLQRFQLAKYLQNKLRRNARKLDGIKEFEMNHLQETPGSTSQNKPALNHDVSIL